MRVFARRGDPQSGGIPCCGPAKLSRAAEDCLSDRRPDGYPASHAGCHPARGQALLQNIRNVLSSKITIIVAAAVVIVAAVTVLLLGKFKFGWFDGDTSGNASSDAGTSISVEGIAGEEETNIGDIIAINTHNDRKVTFVYYGKQLEGVDNLDHLAFHVGDYSISVDDWDNTGNLKQCSVWVRDRENEGENPSYKLFKEATYKNENSVITIDTDFNDIPEIDPYNMNQPCQLHVEYHNGGNYNYDFDWNTVTYYDGNDSGAEGESGSASADVQDASISEQDVRTDEEAVETARYMLAYQRMLTFIYAGEVYHYEELDPSHVPGEYQEYYFEFDFDEDGNVSNACGTFLSVDDSLKYNFDAQIIEDISKSEIEVQDYWMEGEETACFRCVIKGYTITVKADFANKTSHTMLEMTSDSADSSSTFAHVDGGVGEINTPEDIEELEDRLESEGYNLFWKK